MDNVEVRNKMIQVTILFGLMVALFLISLKLGLLSKRPEKIEIPLTQYPDRTLYDKEATVYVYDREDVVIIAFTCPFEFIFRPYYVATMAEIADELNCRYIINGSYYDGTDEEPTHAGRLRIFGKEVAPLKRDRQLSHVVIYNPAKGDLKFVERSEADQARSDSTVEFQTGPLFIKNNQIQEQFIKRSLNGLGLYSRSVLAYTDDGVKYFILFKSGSLFMVAKFLLNSSVFMNKKLTAVNLDGGRSTALCSKVFPQINHNTQKHLPILLIIR